MAITRVLDEEDRQMLETLRKYGLDDEVRHYEALLRGEVNFASAPDPLPDPVPGATPIAEAAKRLGMPRREVRRHIELGLLASETDSETGETLVTNTSIALFQDGRRRLAIIARPLPGDVDEPLDPNSLLGRMFAEASEPHPDDEEA
jgi:hypothetical protein